MSESIDSPDVKIDPTELLMAKLVNLTPKIL